MISNSFHRITDIIKFMDIKFKKALAETQKYIDDKKRKCMYGNCSEKAIKSHVLQKNGILKEMSEFSHIKQLQPPNLFQDEDALFNIESVWINDAYTFKWFCGNHDTSIFKPIEDPWTMDLYNPIHQALFAYRALCQEIRRKEKAIELVEWTRSRMPRWSWNNQILNSYIDWFKCGIMGMNYFKSELETWLENNNLSQFIFETIEMPKIEICISTPLSVEEDIPHPNWILYKDYLEEQSRPFPTSFINIFPKWDLSYAILGYHKSYPCKWTQELMIKLRKGNRELIFKEMSDLLVLRLEFWAMSPELFRSIPSEVIEEYKDTFTEHAMNHSPSLTTSINLFASL